nr:MAG TPA: hypothetical protein [Caudoviricetes sp.]
MPETLGNIFALIALNSYALQKLPDPQFSRYWHDNLYKFRPF